MFRLGYCSGSTGTAGYGEALRKRRGTRKTKAKNESVGERRIRQAVRRARRLGPREVLAPLRDRPDDIAPLAFALVLRHVAQGRAQNRAQGRDLPWISDAALAMLRLHGWPGNVRELENVVRRALLLADGKDMIGAEHIVFDQPARLVPALPTTATPVVEARPGAKLSNSVQLSEARAIMDTLEACGGSRIETARRLGISERTLRYRLASFREAGLAVAGGRG